MQVYWQFSFSYAIASRMEKKIIDIEITLAHHEQQIAEMSEVITDQWKMIDALKYRLEKALAKIEQIEGGDDSAQGEDALSGIEFARQNIPPHF